MLKEKSTALVKIKVFMTWSTVVRVDGDDPVIYSDKCNNEDFFVAADFLQVREVQKVDKVFGRLAPQKRFILELDVTGRLASSFFPRFGHLGWSRYQFRAVEVHSLKDVTGKRNVVRPDHDADAPDISFATHLQLINTESVLYFLGANSLPEITTYFTQDFTALDPMGRKYDRDNYRGLADEWFGKGDVNLAVRTASGFCDDRSCTVTGDMRVERVPGKKKELNYENVFIRSKDSVLLSHTRFGNP